MTLTEFLLARIAGDEEFWREHTGDMEHGGCAERVLAECEAKRRIVETYAGGLAPDDYGHMFDAMRALASVYADHPDYRDEWKP